VTFLFSLHAMYVDKTSVFSIFVKIKVATTSLRLNINLTLRLINRSEHLAAHFWLLFKAFYFLIIMWWLLSSVSGHVGL